MQALDALGAGFTLASHDLDIRGAGNLLGDEQSGHIREVGIELYQQMLEDAVAEARGARGDAHGHAEWSPQISLGISVLIPESLRPRPRRAPRPLPPARRPRRPSARSTRSPPSWSTASERCRMR